MEYVQMDLEGMMAPKLRDDVYVHECQLIAVNKETIDAECHLKRFNEKHETTKFILSKCSKTNNGLKMHSEFSFRLVQLGVETPFLYEVVAFLANLGMDLVSVSCRSYLVTDIPDTIKPEEDGISDFLNEIFCLEKCDTYCGSMSFDLFETAHRYQSVLKPLGFEMETFNAVVFNASGRYEYLRLTEAKGSRSHNFKASFWQQEQDGLEFYAESHRIETKQFDDERQKHRQAALNLLKDIDGTKSFDELILPF